MNRYLLKVSAALIVAFVLAACGSDGAAPNPTDEPSIPASMSTEGTDEVQAVAPGPDASVFVAGYSFGGAAPGDLQDYWFLRRYDRNGMLVWGLQVDRCQNPPVVEDVGIAPGTYIGCRENELKLASDGGGNVFVVSKSRAEYAYSPNRTTSYVSKYGSDGKLLWDQQVAEQAADETSTEGWNVLDLKTNAAGDLFVLETAVRVNSLEDETRLARLSGDNGSRLWEGSVGAQYRAALAVSDDGVYVAGAPDSQPDEAIPRLQRWSLDGTKVWERELPGTRFFDYLGLATVGSRVLLVSGTSEVSIDPMFEAGPNEVTSLDDTGNVVWQETLEAEPSRGITALAVDAEGRLYLIGRAFGASGDTSFLMRYAADGDFSWEHYLTAVDEQAVSQGGLAPRALATAQVSDRFGKPGTTLYLGGASFGDRNQTNIDAFASAVNDITENPDETYKDLDVWQEWLRN